MIFNKDTVEYVSKLARLHLSEEEKNSFSMELSSIVSYVEKLNELDISNVAPTNHILSINNIHREDESNSYYTKEENLSNAPNKKDGCFIVPKVVE